MTTTTSKQKIGIYFVRLIEIEKWKVILIFPGYVLFRWHYTCEWDSKRTRERVLNTKTRNKVLQCDAQTIYCEAMQLFLRWYWIRIRPEPKQKRQTQPANQNGNNNSVTFHKRSIHLHYSICRALWALFHSQWELSQFNALVCINRNANTSKHVQLLQWMIMWLVTVPLRFRYTLIPMGIR